MLPLRTKASPISEATLVDRWLSGRRGAHHTEDGRSLRVIFPGVPGGGPGPDVCGAVLELAGDELRGDIEVHLKSRGWYQHGHHDDPAYGGVILHLVAQNDGGTLASSHVSGRAVPIAVTGQQAFPAYSPPCALHPSPVPVLAILGLRRLEAKASAAIATVASAGPAQALYESILKTAGGPANGAAFEHLACTLRLAPLLERAPPGPGRRESISALLAVWAEPLHLSTRGRPTAHPARRLASIAGLLEKLWPASTPPGWPPALSPGARLSPELKVSGLGSTLVRELIINAVLPVGVASQRWSSSEAAKEIATLGSPGTYGRLRRLEGWLTRGQSTPFTKTDALQGGLLLHNEYCSRGRCGDCPLSRA